MRDPHSRDAGSTPVRAAEYGQVAELGYTRRSERRARKGVRVRLSPWLLYCRCGRCPTGFHKAGEPGSIPGSATRGWASAQRSLISSDRRVRPPDPPRPSTQTGKAVTPQSVAILWVRLPLRSLTIPWSNGEDACVTCRKVLVRFQPGSLGGLRLEAVGLRENGVLVQR